MHGSPLPAGEGRRFSFDLRVAACCPDDNAHYRYNFANLNNFLCKGGRAAIGLDTEYAAPCDYRALDCDRHDDVPALFYWLAAGLRSGIAGTEVAAILDVFDRHPFAEDRYLDLARHFGPTMPEIAACAAQAVTDRSVFYFWVLAAARVLRGLGQTAAAKQAAERARDLARGIDELPNFAPVAYANPFAQLDPASALRQAEAFLSE
jgi:hypothetical protein